MDFVDNCIDLKIKRYRKTASGTLFSKSFTEYEIQVLFHSLIITNYRRYSQFREFREKVKFTQLPLSIQDSLAPFPKKKLLKKGEKLSNQRRDLLEKWIQSLLVQREYRVQLLSFLGIPENLQKILASCSGCTLIASEKIVAKLLRDLSKPDKNRSKALKSFDNNFFCSPEYCLGKTSQILLLNTLVPLCKDPSLACLAIEILHKLIRIDCYRFAGEIEQCLVNNLDLLREIGIDQHILNEYSQETGKQGYFIAKLVKEHFDRNGMERCFKYVLNFNELAYEQFCVKCEGKVSKVPECRNTIVAGRVGEWKWMNTDNYPGGLKVCFRKMEKHLEVRAEIFIEANLHLLSTYLLIPKKRKQWDLFLNDIKPLKKIDDHTNWILYSIKKPKKEPPTELLLETRKSESLGKYLITFNSITSESPNKRVECDECFYEVQNVDVKVRRSSSTADEYESDEDDVGSLKSCCSALMLEQKSMSKVVFVMKMRPEMARIFVNDLSEETSVLKESLVCLKRTVEKVG